MCQAQQKIKNVRQQISDILHAAQVNKQSLMCILKTPLQQKQIPSSQHKSIQLSSLISHYAPSLRSLFSQIAYQFQCRPSFHLNYLITKQIQSQQESVRRDRLLQYQDRIYDQRRIVADKEVFLESLYRPKKKRQENVTPEQFQEFRNLQKLQEEKLKLLQLQQELRKLQRWTKSYEKKYKPLQQVNKYDLQRQQYCKQRNLDLQATKSNSLQVQTPNATIDKQQKIQQSQLQKFTPLDMSPSMIIQPTTSQVQTQTQCKKSPLKSMIDRLKSNLLQDKDNDTDKKIRNMLHVVQKIQQSKRQNQSKLKVLRALQKQNKQIQQHIKGLIINYHVKNNQ